MPTALRFHAIETGWFARFRQTVLYRYTFDAVAFRPWPKARGQYIATTTIEPTTVVAIRNLEALHQASSIDLRTVDNLWPLHDVAEQGPWDFSIVRMRNAQPRSQ